MPSFYAQLRDALVARGVSREQWAAVVRIFKNPKNNDKRCFRGTAPGRMILASWRLEERIDPARVQDLANPLATSIRALGPEVLDGNLMLLQCCRGFESTWGAPSASLSRTDKLTSAKTITELVRHYLGADPSGGVVAAGDYAALERLLKQKNIAEQKKLLALFKRPLGRRDSSPANCRSWGPPYLERFSLVWASREKDVPHSVAADDLRDMLGLVHFRRGEKVICFGYQLPSGTTARIPTSVEALGSWQYSPARPRQRQRSVNYQTGARGPREFVHAAEVDPGGMEYRWVGELGRNWDD